LKVVEKPVVLQELSSKLAAKSVAFLETAARNQRPFLLFHSFTHVHTPHATRLVGSLLGWWAILGG
jgi:hypothetical protein